jgi:phage/plasmid-like protein (TIGR03299 family)
VAHELDFNVTTGKRAMFSVRETPWHREGVILNAAPTLAEALQLAGCGFEVETRPIWTKAADGSMLASPHGRAIVRTDRGEILGEAVLSVVSDKYVPLQNRDAFAVLEPLLDQGVAHLETGGTLRGGRDVWMLVRFDVTDPVVQEVFAAEVTPFGLITNNHAGEARALVMETPIRVVCANTLGMALTGWRDRANAIAVTHRGDAKVRMVDAAEKLFSGLVERYRTIAEQYRALKARILTVEEFTEHVLNHAAPLPGDLHGLRTDHLTVRGYDMAREAAERRRSAITQAWHGGKGHTGDGSAWEGYNGAVEVIDHDSELFRTKGSRVAGLLGGRLLERKTAVLNSLAKLCEIGQN